VVRGDGGLAQVAREFFCVVVKDMRGVDLSLFEFDYDETWAAFLMNARGRVYARVFGRDHTSPLSHRSLEGLVRTLRRALEIHRTEAARDPDPPPVVPWKRIDDVPSFRKWRRPADCAHCHNVQEDLRRQEYEDGTWRRERIWTWPPPENLGLSPDRNDPARLREVASGSAADRAGLRAGDRIRRVGGTATVGPGDLFLALQRAPETGELAVAYARDGREEEARVRLEAGWRRADLSWRASLALARPDPGMNVRDLDPPEKRPMGLAEDALAVRVQAIVKGGAAQWAGLEKGDILVWLAAGESVLSTAVNDRRLQAWFRTECLPGDRVRVALLRGGARREAVLELPK
jgi:hypothetical protein